MEIKISLTSKGICDIIQSCKDNGVNYFECDVLKVQFGQANTGLVGIWPAIEGTQSTPTQNGSFEPPTQLNEQKIDQLHQRAIEDLAQAQTLMDDPMQFEQDMSDGLLNEQGGDDAKTEESGRVTNAL